MSEDTIYERVAKLEDEVAALREDVDIFRTILKNKIAKMEIKKVKDGLI